MKTLAQVLLWVSGLGYAGFGVAFLLAPLRTMALAGIALEGGVAAVELRAFYGGLELALGGLICALALKPARRRDGLVLSAVCYLGIGLARLSGMLQFGADSAFLRFAVATDLTLGIASVLLAKRA